MMAAFDDLLPLLAPHVPNAPHIAMVNALRQSVTDFCRRTRCWRHQENVVMTAPSPTTTLDALELTSIQDFGQIFEIEYVRWGTTAGRDLEPVSATDFPEKEFETGIEPQFYTQITPNSIRLTPGLPVGATWTVGVSLFLEPIPVGMEWPEELQNRFGQDIAYGAASKLQIHPDKPYTNPQLALVNESRFERACVSNFRFNLRGQQRAKVRTKGSFF